MQIVVEDRMCKFKKIVNEDIIAVSLRQKLDITAWHVKYLLNARRCTRFNSLLDLTFYVN